MPMITPLIRRQRCAHKLAVLAGLMGDKPLGRAAKEVALGAGQSFYEMDDMKLERRLDRAIKEWQRG